MYYHAVIVTTFSRALRSLSSDSNSSECRRSSIEGNDRVLCCWGWWGCWGWEVPEVEGRERERESEREGHECVW